MLDWCAPACFVCCVAPLGRTMAVCRGMVNTLGYVPALDTFLLPRPSGLCVFAITSIIKRFFSTY